MFLVDGGLPWKVKATAGGAPTFLTIVCRPLVRVAPCPMYKVDLKAVRWRNAIQQIQDDVVCHGRQKNALAFQVANTNGDSLAREQ